MEPKSKNNECLFIRAFTWFKDSHSLYDYESNKISSISFTVPLTAQAVSVYRKRESSTILCQYAGDDNKIDQEQYQFLTRFQLKIQNSLYKLRLEFFNDSSNKNKLINNEPVTTEEITTTPYQNEEDTYLIIRKIKDINNEQKGYKLVPGQNIKLGRVEYFVSEIKGGQKLVTASTKTKHNQNSYNRKVLKFQYNSNTHEKNACKICLQDIDTPENFLFNPCKCSGSCGTVHLECIVSWIHFKVKKEAIGGTLHFNFNKFECQVCKFELPMIIDVNGEHKELLPIEKPTGNYLILQSACQKVKSVMLIQNVPQGGIKLGRGHDCEIRITDISVSRNHALIKNIGNNFFIFDNKSKFGTLVREESMALQINKSNGRSVQIGRTTLNFELRKQHHRDIKTEGGIRIRNPSQQ